MNQLRHSSSKYDFSVLSEVATVTPGKGHGERQRRDGSRTGSSIITPLDKSSFISLGSSSSKSRSSRSTSGGLRSSVTPRSAPTPTSGSASCSSSSTPGHQRTSHSSAIVSIVEGRGLAKGEVGLATIDLKNPVLLLSQFPDSQTYVKVLTKLLHLDPTEIVLPNTVCDSGARTKLYQLLLDHFDETTLTTVQRKYFNESKGLEYIHQLCAPEFSSVEVDVSTKYYCLAAAAALLKYVEFIQNIVYAPGSLKVCFKGSEQTATIDVTTVKNLELLTNARDPASSHSLYGILNYTKTVGGARLLRSNILEPPSSLHTVQLRQNCVQELTENEDMFYGLESVLRRFLDVDHLISLLISVPKRDTHRTAENTIANVIHLKHVLQLVDPLKTSLEDSSDTLLKAFYQVLTDPRFKIICEAIQSVVHDDTHFQKGALYMRAQKCFCIKSGLNGMLDISRQLYTEIIDDISELTKQVAEKYNLPVKSAFSAGRGFHLQLYTGHSSSAAGLGSMGEKGTGPGEGEGASGISSGKGSSTQLEDLPREFIKVTKQRNTLSLTTVDFIKLNTRASDCLDEIYLLSHCVLKEMLGDVRKHVGCLYRLTECVSMLDMLHSFAHLCTISDYTCPEFTDTLAIKQGRHPILDKIAYEPQVPNNTFASKGANFVIVTGPNMSGKSTYLRQIALLQVMAQVGCYVPAEYASFRVADQIFSRIGSDDDIETNSSTFMVEMREVNYILQNLSDSSLIIIDELGRGTSAEEGVGLCYAICEQLLSTGAYSFIATHFLELNRLAPTYLNVQSYYFDLKLSPDANGEVNPNTHQLKKGVMEQTNYGLHLAKMSFLPAGIVEDAIAISAKVSGLKSQGACGSEESPVRAKVHKLGTQLVQVARNSLLDVHSLRSYMKYLKSNFESCNESVSTPSDAPPTKSSTD